MLIWVLAITGGQRARTSDTECPRSRTGWRQQGRVVATRQNRNGDGGGAGEATGRRQLQGAAVVEYRGDFRAALGRIGARVGQVTMK
jgi:hypothetical protein